MSGTHLCRIRGAYRAEYGESPRIDAISIHTYGWSRNGQHDAARMAAYVAARHDEASELGYDVPVWVTEFGLIPWPGQTYTETDTMLLQRSFLTWATTQPWIARIAWFPSVPAPSWPAPLTQGDQLPAGTAVRGAERRDHRQRLAPERAE